MGNVEEPAKQQAEEKGPLEKPSRCLICAKEGPALLYGHWICDRCKNVVQAEALAQQRRIIKEGGGPGVGPEIPQVPFDRAFSFDRPDHPTPIAFHQGRKAHRRRIRGSFRSSMAGEEFIAVESDTGGTYA